MKRIRQNAKPLCAFSTFLVLLISVPLDPVLAAMVGTEATLDLTRARQARDEINKLLLREGIQNALMSQGIDPVEAKARIDSLSDAEVVRLADQIDKLPAGGRGIQPFPTWVGILFIAGVVAIVILFFMGLVYLGNYIEEKTNSPDAGTSDLPERQNKPIDQRIATFSVAKAAVGPDYNPEEHWTGLWKVEGNNSLIGQWGMKQNGNTVSSTKDSYYELNGKVEGSQLKGKIIGDYGLSQNIILNVSSDGQSFKGTTTYGGRTVRVKGMREQ